MTGARAGGDTLQGRQAYGVLTWVYEDPEARAAEGRARVAELARSAAGAALAEIQDVGAMLSRLSGGVRLSGIAGQALDLAFHPDQKRDAHGHWVKGGGSISAQVRDRPHPEAPQITTAMDNVMKAHAAAAAAQVAGQLRKEHADVVHRLIAQVEDVNKKLATQKTEVEDERKHAARIRLAVEGGVALAGAVLAAALSMIGVVPLAAIAAALAPIAVQLLIEFKKKV